MEKDKDVSCEAVKSMRQEALQLLRRKKNRNENISSGKNSFTML